MVYAAPMTMIQTGLNWGNVALLYLVCTVKAAHAIPDITAKELYDAATCCTSPYMHDQQCNHTLTISMEILDTVSACQAKALQGQCPGEAKISAVLIVNSVICFVVTSYILVAQYIASGYVEVVGVKTTAAMYGDKWVGIIIGIAVSVSAFVEIPCLPGSALAAAVSIACAIYAIQWIAYINVYTTDQRTGILLSATAVSLIAAFQLLQLALGTPNVKLLPLDRNVVVATAIMILVHLVNAIATSWATNRKKYKHNPNHRWGLKKYSTTASYERAHGILNFAARGPIHLYTLQMYETICTHMGPATFNENNCAPTWILGEMALTAIFAIETMIVAVKLMSVHQDIYSSVAIILVAAASSTMGFMIVSLNLRRVQWWYLCNVLISQCWSVEESITGHRERMRSIMDIFGMQIPQKCYSTPLPENISDFQKWTLCCSGCIRNNPKHDIEDMYLTTNNDAGTYNGVIPGYKKEGLIIPNPIELMVEDMYDSLIRIAVIHNDISRAAKYSRIIYYILFPAVTAVSLAFGTMVFISAPIMLIVYSGITFKVYVCGIRRSLRCLPEFNMVDNTFSQLRDQNIPAMVASNITDQVFHLLNRHFELAEQYERYWNQYNTVEHRGNPDNLRKSREMILDMVQYVKYYDNHKTGPDTYYTNLNLKLVSYVNHISSADNTANIVYRNVEFSRSDMQSLRNRERVLRIMEQSIAVQVIAARVYIPAMAEKQRLMSGPEVRHVFGSVCNLRWLPVIDLGGPPDIEEGTAPPSHD
jgi:hypothetical protein